MSHFVRCHCVRLFSHGLGFFLARVVVMDNLHIYLQLLHIQPDSKVVQLPLAVAKLISNVDLSKEMLLAPLC